MLTTKFQTEEISLPGTTITDSNFCCKVESVKRERIFHCVKKAPIYFNCHFAAQGPSLFPPTVFFFLGTHPLAILILPVFSTDRKQEVFNFSSHLPSKKIRKIETKVKEKEKKNLRSVYSVKDREVRKEIRTQSVVAMVVEQR